MFDLEDRHWWFQGRWRMVRRAVERLAPASGAAGRRLLDIGCGTGMFLQRQPFAARSVGLDASRRALGFTRRRGGGPLVCGDSQRLPFADSCFDLVTAFDLIEHVSLDSELVAEAWRVLRPGGLLVATVPAHPFLWSGHDVALHHKRRYRRREFEALFDPARWRTRRMTYIFAAILPPAAIVRLARRALKRGGVESADTKTLRPAIDAPMLAWHSIEAAWVARFDLPFGLSLMTAREKIGQVRP